MKVPVKIKMLTLEEGEEMEERGFTVAFAKTLFFMMFLKKMMLIAGWRLKPADFLRALPKLF